MSWQICEIGQKCGWNRMKNFSSQLHKRRISLYSALRLSYRVYAVQRSAITVNIRVRSFLGIKQIHTLGSAFQNESGVGGWGVVVLSLVFAGSKQRFSHGPTRWSDPPGTLVRPRRSSGSSANLCENGGASRTHMTVSLQVNSCLEEMAIRTSG